MSATVIQLTSRSAAHLTAAVMQLTATAPDRTRPVVLSVVLIMQRSPGVLRSIAVIAMRPVRLLPVAMMSTLRQRVLTAVPIATIW